MTERSVTKTGRSCARARWVQRASGIGRVGRWDRAEIWDGIAYADGVGVLTSGEDASDGVTQRRQRPRAATPGPITLGCCGPTVCGDNHRPRSRAPPLPAHVHGVHSNLRSALSVLSLSSSLPAVL